MNRTHVLELIRQRAEPWDIVIIGGGATGVGCALDAVTRGLDVLLLEKLDLGKGTSSRSTKLAHGGVRYLRQGNLRLVREALTERGIMLKNAPHAVHRLPFVIPTYSRAQTLFYSAGLKIYDRLAGSEGFGKTRSLSPFETSVRIPGLSAKGLAGGVLYSDGQFDDVQLLIDIAVEAAARGAKILNYVPVTGLRRTGNRITGVEFTDSESGENFGVEAKVVINAAGVFCDSIRRMAEPSTSDLITFSQGIHIVLDKQFLDSECGLMIPKTSDGRVLFAIPWKGTTLLGTTDTPIESADSEPVAKQAEIDFVLETAGRYLRSRPGRSDIRSIFAGIRPLVRNGVTSRTSELSRSHTLREDVPGLLTITGGKWTTYRLMAEQTIDRAIQTAGMPQRTCSTRNLKINSRHRSLQLDDQTIGRFIETDFARTVEDVLARRTQLLFTDARAANNMAAKVAGSMAKVLHKDKIWENEQTSAFRKLSAQYLPNDPH
jgi:glycerol-3-phosphate dehydrogenase